MAKRKEEVLRHTATGDCVLIISFGASDLYSNGHRGIFCFEKRNATGDGRRKTRQHWRSDTFDTFNEF